ncbi:15169_t:CDS:2 [Funneliformis caledonium]|uniref:15169_t:CDS:1 n=1 Tax=Funneliformis caledonium TaxID=1117310 RepID=A0A9N9GR53_9GLOM|nr:15169_t:CDS:2 [Funneliformis caledonium]
MALITNKTENLIPALSHFKPHLKAEIETISTDFIECINILPTYGIILRNYMDREKFISNDLPRFVKDYAIAITEALKERFPNSELFDALNIF